MPKQIFLPQNYGPPAPIMETALSYQKSRVLLTAYELGIFTALGGKSKGSKEVAKILKVDIRATDRLMNALVALDLLKKKKSEFSNTNLTGRFLVKGKPGYLAGLMHSVNLWNGWGTLTEAVRKGRSVLKGGRFDKSWTKSFIAAMDDRAKAQAPATARIIDLKGVSRVLDVGGGSGAYSIEFVKIKSGISAVIFDLPSVIYLTKNYIKNAALSNRIETCAGDYTKDKLGSDFDLVYLSAIVHSNSARENIALIKKSAAALNKSGRVVVQDFVMDEDRINPPFGALFALIMLLQTDAGDTYTESEITDWMKIAGLVDIQRKDTPFGTAIISGRKP